MDGMSLADQLDALDDANQNVTTAVRDPDGGDDEITAKLRADGLIDQVKNAVVNRRDVDQVDAVAKSTADDYQSQMYDWEKEIKYRQDLLDDPAISGQPVDILKSNLAYAQRKFDEAKAGRDRAAALNRDSMSEFGVGFAHSVLGAQVSKGYALKQYGETAGSDRLSGAGAGIAEVLGGELENVRQPMTMADIHGASDFGRYLLGSAGSATGILADLVATGAVTGGTGVLAEGIVLGQGQMRQSLEAAGVTDPAALAKGSYTYGSLIGALQIAVPWGVMRGLTRPAAEAFAGTVGQISAQVAAGTLKTSIAQSLAMGLSSVAEVYGVTDATGKPIDWTEVVKHLPEAMAKGALVGALFGGYHEGSKLMDGGYKLTKPPSTPEEIAAFLKAAGAPEPGAAFQAERERFDAERAASEAQGRKRLPAPGVEAEAASETSTEAPAGRPEAFADELADLATQRTPEAAARRAEIETQLAQAQRSGEDASIVADLAKQDEDIGSPVLSEAYSNLSDGERSEVVARAKAGENPADLVEELTIRGVQIRGFLSDNAVDLPPHDVADISSRMAGGIPVEDAIRSYAQDQYRAEAAKRQGALTGEEGGPGTTTVPAGPAARAGTGATDAAGAGGDATGPTDTSASGTASPSAASGEPTTTAGGEPAGTAVGGMEPGPIRAGGERLPELGAGGNRSGGAQEAGQSGGAAQLARQRIVEIEPIREIITPDGSMTVPVAPEIVELASLKLASGVLQPRDRSRAESQVQVRNIAAHLDPQQLQPARVSDSGAPMVSADGTVVSGNGRTMALQTVYRDPALRAQADAYRASLGPAAKGMKEPVLISRLAAMSDSELQRFADLSNRSRISSMSATERALRDASSAGPEVMGLYQGGSFTAPANRDFFRAFMAKAVQQNERGAISRDGMLTKEGEDRLSAAALASAYGDPALLARMLESTDDNIRNITGAIRDAAGAIIRMKEAIRRGEASEKFDITPQITETAKRIADLRDRNIKPQQFLAQQDAFTQIDPIVESLLRAFYNDDLSRALSREKLTEVLTRYAEEAEKHTGHGLIPDETSPEDIIAGSRERAFAAERIAASQGDIFAGGASDAGRSAAGAGQPGPGSKPEASREPTRPASTVTDEQHAQFRDILRSASPRKQWASDLGVNARQLDELIGAAERDGLLRVDRNGVVRRTAKARTGEATPEEEAMLAIDAYHGTPHEVDRFDMSKIGTGEGAQAFGYGLYFAENPDVAKSYQDVLTTTHPIVGKIRDALDRSGGDKEAALNYLSAKQAFAESPEMKDAYQQAIDGLNSGKSAGGNLYRVTLDVDHHQLLDWDKPLSEQKGMLQKLKTIAHEIMGGEGNDQLAESLISNRDMGMFYNEMSKFYGSPQAAAARLREAGIPGIRYLDQDSRAPAPSLNGKPIEDPALVSYAQAKLDGTLDRMESNMRAQLETLRNKAIPTEEEARALFTTPQQIRLRTDSAIIELEGELANLEEVKSGDVQPGLEGTRNIVLFDDNLVKIIHKNGEPVSSKERADALEQMHSEQDAQSQEEAKFALPRGRKGQTNPENSDMLGAENGGTHERSAEDRSAVGREGGEAATGEPAAGGVARAGESVPSHGPGASDAGFRDRALERIVRQESASLDGNGDIIVGRRSTKSKAGKGRAAGDGSQRVGTTESVRVGKYEGRVTAEGLLPFDASQGNLARLKYEIPGAAEMEIVQRSDGAWEVDSVKVGRSRRGIGTQLYDSVEKDLGIRLSPSGILTDAGLAFWKKRSPASVQWHQSTPTWGNDFNFSPRKVDSELSRVRNRLAELAAQGNKGTADAQKTRRDLVASLQKEHVALVELWAKLPPEAKAAKDTMFSLPGFYSPAIRAAENIRQEKGTGEQFWKQIAKVPGVKKDELDWMGLEDFLKDKKSVTKAEMLDFMRAHQVQLDEKVLGADPSTKTDRSEISLEKFRQLARLDEDEFPGSQVTKIEQLSGGGDSAFIVSSGRNDFVIYDGYGQATQQVENHDVAVHIATGMLHVDNELATRFDQFKVPGGSNYREMLIRLPELGAPKDLAALKQQLAPLKDQLSKLEPARRSLDVNERDKYYEVRDKVLALENDIYRLENGREDEVAIYNSKHFQDQELVHLRVDDRTIPAQGPSPERAATIEARLGELKTVDENGVETYKPAGLVEANALMRELHPTQKVLFINELQSDLHQVGRQIGYATASDMADADALLKKIQDKVGEYVHPNTISHVLNRSHVLSRFGGSDSEFGMKHMDDIINAMSDDDIAAWSRLEPGLPKIPNAPFKGDLWLELALKRALQYATENGYDAVSWARSDQIAQRVGAAPEQLALQYDSKIGKFLDKYTKKWGGKVEETNGVVKTTWDDESGRASVGGENQLLRITPEMRASVSEGQPLFAVRGNQWSALAAKDMDGIRADIDAAVSKSLPVGWRAVIKSRLKFGDLPEAFQNRNPAVPKDLEIEGTFDPYERVVYVSLAALDPVERAYEEAGHALKSLGLIPEKDYGILEAKAKEIGARERFNIDERYKDIYAKRYGNSARLEDALNEEAIMQMVAARASGETFGRSLNAILDKVVRFLKAIRDALGLRGFRGFDDVFSDITQGGFAKGAAEAPASEAMLARKSTPIDPIEETFNDLRAELGLKMPETAKKGQRTAAPKQQSGVEPPVPNGMVRVYHSGSVGEGKSGRWVSTSRDYAANYRKDLPLHYADISENDPRVNNASYPDQGVKQGFTFNFELKPDEAKKLKEISRDQTASASTKASGPRPSLREQMVAIANEGGEQIAQLYGRQLAPLIARHSDAIQDFALPLSTDRIGEGFSRFFREFVLRPNGLRARQPELYNDFSDFLDAEAPQLLEALDKMHELGRQRLAGMQKRAGGVPGGTSGSSGGRTPPPTGGSPSAAPSAPQPPAGRSIPFAETFRKFTESWARNFQPELISTKALEADPLFARYKAAGAQEKDTIIARGEELHDHWNTIPEDQRLGFIRDLEMGAPQPTPELAEIAWRYRQLLDQAAKQEAVYGSKAGYVEDYFPHIWDDPAKAREVFKAMSAVKNYGPKWFQKERFFDLIEEGLKAGLRLKSTNPEELVSLRLLAGVDMRQRMELLQQLKKMGLAREAKGASGFDAAGWQAINAPTMEQWLLAPDVQALWKNAVDAQGLWGNEHVAGSIFRNWMAFKNVWVPIKLALSFFHPLHVAHINMSNNLARAWTQMTRAGDLGGAMESLVSAFDQRQGVGYDARMAWLKPAEERTPSERALVDLMTDGGFVPQLSEQLRIAGRRSFQKAVAEGHWLKAMPLALRRGLELLQGRIFERWIPGLKAAAYVKEAQALFERRPDLLDDNIQRRVALRAIAKSVDNRFGEMFYGNLFWNRTIKDAGIASFLSLGWNLGFVREFGGGTLEAVTRQFYQGPRPRQTIRAATNKTAFVIAYVTSAAVINGMMNYLFTGDMPGGYDFIFPRIGGLNPDGSPRRITNMFYTREIPMAKKHIEEQDSVLWGLGEMLYNKMMFQPFVELAENRDYWGYEIWSEHDPIYKKAAALAKHILVDQLSPITASGAQRAKDIGGSWTDKGVPLSFLGFGPAPAYVERTPLENRIRHDYQTFVAPLKKPYEREDADTAKREAKDQLKLALQRGDAEAAAAARAKAKEAGATARALSGSSLRSNPSTYLFSRLPEETQRHLLQDASPDEVQTYRKFAKRTVRREFPAQPVQSGRQPEAVH